MENSEDLIKNKIYTIRNVQVMLDSDLAQLYNVETNILNKAVKRNKERFPENFMFQLTELEFKSLILKPITSQSQILISQIATSSETTNQRQILKCQIGTSSWGGKRKLPYVFTEQGVAMLSGVLRSETAVKVSIQIVNAFVNMRKFIASNAQIFQRLDSVETKQLEYKIETNKNFEKVFSAIEDKSFQKKQGIFFEGQIFDAYTFVSDLIRSAKTSIILIDNYIDDSVLTLFSKNPVKVTIYTNISKQLRLDLEKYNSQYKNIQMQEFNQSHDRFLILDHKEVYHFGASLKDLGKKWFAFSKFDKEAFKLLDKLNLK